jgi:hypothetical protein
MGDRIGTHLVTERHTMSLTSTLTVHTGRGAATRATWARRLAAVALFGCVAIVAAGCSQGAKHDNVFADASSPSITLKDRVVEVACGQCLYGMDIPDCRTAIRVDGVVYLAEGPGVPDAEDHATGVCDSLQHARVSGQTSGGTFHATSFVMLP